MLISQPLPSSFRDPSGFVFEENGVVYRKVRASYQRHYAHLIASGLYGNLIAARLLVVHDESDIEANRTASTFKILKPAKVPFISYPYEWSFGQLKSAALTTLRIQKMSLACGMSLKDSSAFNIQFIGSKPTFIDTLSFELYEEGKPWVAYKQFCQHFLAPLALMAYVDLRLNRLLQSHIDGVPLDLASKLLPKRCYLNLGLLMHIFLHVRSQQAFAGKVMQGAKQNFPKRALLWLLDSLEECVRGLSLPSSQSTWSGYYEDNNYSESAAESKAVIVKELLGKTKPATVWDFGANTGRFSRIAAELGAFTVSIDMDPLCVQHSFFQGATERDSRILPLVMDLTAPTPAIGWSNNERSSLIERGPCDTAMGLALVHHLAIGNNLPFERIAEFFSMVCKNLIIEFVPKTDSQVARLLSSREDVFAGYSQEAFEAEFQKRFEIVERRLVEGSRRTIYLMRRRNQGSEP